ncbi:CDP-glycerol glycerophosphotransferase family protein [Sediminibacillus massiliensis]|uniref:CDP-glycerol glycerophosphotransferase family protein n=1 Tax=Sediminibacillus massiliensis TaxID=1926277 RepID=UPI0009888FAF|nr:CDP-glycerol glycerophosphotransferase family protein [Sediminibacillus massiliensis]
MFTRLKKRLKRSVKRQNGQGNPVVIEGKEVVINSDNVVKYASTAETDFVEQDDLNDLKVHRDITSLNWNGPQLKLEGYFYLEGVPMDNDDLVRKNLLLYCNNEKKFVIPLRDKKVVELQTEETIEEQYQWAGFEGAVNFATLSKGDKPLESGDYFLYLEVEAFVSSKEKYKKVFPLGNIENYLSDGFHAAKMEYFTARREMKYNLLATYDFTHKTLKLVSTKLKDLDPREMQLDAPETSGVFYKFFQKKLFGVIYRLCWIFPVNKKKVLFASDSREELGGNFKFVYDEMASRDLDLTYEFALKKGVGEKKSYGELIHLAYQLATSKFILLDDFYPMVYPLTIRRNSELIQLWHAVGAFKTFGFSRIGRPGGPSPKSLNHRNYTKVTVSSKNIAPHYAEGFGIPEENVVATGIPRTDIFFDEDYKQTVREEIYQEHPYLKGKKVIMFAPTFRGNGQQSAHYRMEALNLEKLYNELSDEYVFILKIHPFVKNDIQIPYQYTDFFYDFSDYREINDLLFITDILVTDYSSVCFEFALLNKPMIFFAYDVEEYVQKRDFYYNYHSFIPGPLAKTTEDLIRTIHQEDYKMDKIEPFINYFFDHIDGQSSRRVVDQLILEKEEEETLTDKG